MAASTAKVILFSRVIVNKKTYQWPTAVFNKHDDAKSYATVLGMAHRNGDVTAAQAMDKDTKVDSDGKLIPGLRFSIVEVPYSPSASLGAADMFDEPETPTS